MNRLSLLFLISVYLLNIGTVELQAQSEASTPKEMIGLQLGYGSHHLLDIDYDYRVVFFQGQYFRSLIRGSKWTLEALVQPQFNTMRYRFSTTEPELRNGIEFGLNAGVVARRHWLEGKHSIFLCLSAGPHYVSGAPRRQSDGFIFSDNLFLGYQAQLRPDLFLDLRIGGRHISNANLETPNGGVNSAFFSLGLNWKISLFST